MLHDEMRKLWEDHITWTRLAIISLAENLPDLPATQARLLANQDDVGNAIKPYYGNIAGKRLTTQFPGPVSLTFPLNPVIGLSGLRGRRDHTITNHGMA